MPFLNQKLDNSQTKYQFSYDTIEQSPIINFLIKGFGTADAVDHLQFVPHLLCSAEQQITSGYDGSSRQSSEPRRKSSHQRD